MKVYGIAAYLTLEQKQAMATAVYDSRGERGGPLTCDGRCAIAVGVPDCPMNPSAPDGETVAGILYHDAPEYLDLWAHVDDYRDDEAFLAATRRVEIEIAQLAQEFIDDWDAGRIPPAELPRALGLVG